MYSRKKRKTVAIVCHSRDSYDGKIATYIREGVESAELSSKQYDCSYTKNMLDELTGSDAIIFGSPSYFGAAPAKMKEFMDQTSSIWQNKLWSNKIAGAFTHSSSLSGDKLSVLQQFFIFAQQHGMIWVGLDVKSCQMKEHHQKLNYLGSWSGLMTLSSDKNQVLAYDNETDKLTARYFGARIAKITKGLNL